MKTAFKAKIIFESDKMSEWNPDVPRGIPEFNFRDFRKLINEQPDQYQLECILDYFTSDTEPVIIIKQS